MATSESIQEQLPQDRVLTQPVTSREKFIGAHVEISGSSGFDCIFDHAVVEIVDLRGDLSVERRSTPHTQIGVGRCLTITPGTVNRRPDVSLVVKVDIDAVHGGELLFLRFAGELGDVSRDDRRAPSTTLTILDERLGLVLLGEPVRIRLSEVRRRHRPFDIGASSGLTKYLQEELVTDALWFVQMTPDQVITVAGVFRLPARHPWNRPNQVNVVFTTLSVDPDLDRVLGVSDLVEREVEQLTTTEAALELQGDERAVAVIMAGIDHRPDVVVPVEHIGFVGLGLVITGRLRRDPVVRVGDVLAARRVLGEHPEGDSVVAVRLLAAVLDVIGVVDPADDHLGGVLCGVEVIIVALGQDGVDEFDVSVLARTGIVSEQLLVSVPAVLFTSKLELVAEREQKIAIGVASTTVTGLEFCTECVDGILRSHITPIYMWDVKPLVESPPPASTNSFTIPTNNQPQVTGAGFTGGVAA